MPRWRNIPTQAFGSQSTRRARPGRRSFSPISIPTVAFALLLVGGAVGLVPAAWVILGIFACSGAALVLSVISVASLSTSRKGDWVARARTLERQHTPLRAHSTLMNEWAQANGLQMGAPMTVRDALDYDPLMLLGAQLAYIDPRSRVHVQEHELRTLRPRGPSLENSEFAMVGAALMGSFNAPSPDAMRNDSGETMASQRITLIAAPCALNVAGLILRPRGTGAPAAGEVAVPIENADLLKHALVTLDDLHPLPVGMLLLPPPLQEKLAELYAHPAATQIRLLRARRGSITAIIEAPLEPATLAAAGQAAQIVRELTIAWAAR